MPTKAKPKAPIQLRELISQLTDILADKGPGPIYVEYSLLIDDSDMGQPIYKTDVTFDDKYRTVRFKV